jgi:hypothetical protein
LARLKERIRDQLELRDLPKQVEVVIIAIDVRREHAQVWGEVGKKLS